MGTTLKYGITYPAGNVAPNVPLVMQTLAESAEAGIDTAILKYPQGLLSLTKQTTNSAAISTLAVVKAIPTFSFKAGRKYRIVWRSGYFQTSANIHHALRIQTCSTADSSTLTTGLTQVAGITVTSNVASNSEAFSVEAIYEPGSDTTLQIKFTAQIAAGSGNITVVGSATEPMTFYIEDLGKQF